MYYSSNRKYIAIILITFLTSFIARSGHNTPPPPKINYNIPHQGFTKKNILKIREKMPEKDIEAIFGKPDKIKVDLCGPEDGRWQCLIYVYFLWYGKNIFYFELDYSQPLLNHWKIEHVYQE